MQKCCWDDGAQLITANNGCLQPLAGVMQVSVRGPEGSTPNKVSVVSKFDPSIVIVTSGLPADTIEDEID